MPITTSSAWVGAAKVHITYLHPEKVPLIVDQDNIDRLCQIFKLEGVRRCDRRYRIPVLVDDADLKQILESNGVGAEQLTDLSFPMLQCNGLSFTYLQGQGYHRLAAARATLPVEQQWWCIDIFLRTKLSTELLNFMREDVDNAKPLTDGVIYYKIYTYHRMQDVLNQRKWLARLTPTKRRDVKQLWRQRLAEPVKIAIHSLIDDFPALLSSWKIGTTHRWLPMKCPEELTSYLSHIHQSWAEIVPSEYREYLDSSSVHILEGRCPGLSSLDQDFILAKFRKGELFCDAPDDVKHILRERIARYPTIIPSLKTFIEDVKWLEPSTQILRRLFPTNKNSLRRCMRNHWSNRTGNQNGFWAAYVELHCFAQKEFPSMVSVKPRQASHKGHSERQIKPPAECWWFLASLAQTLGFQSTQIHDILQNSATKHLALAVLTYARPEEFYDMPVSGRADALCSVKRFLEAAAPKIPEVYDIELTSDIYQPWDLRTRCGRPQWESQEVNNEKFSMDCLYPQIQIQEIRRRTITSFYVMRAKFHIFFGKDDSKFTIENEALNEDNIDASILDLDELSSLGTHGERGRQPVDTMIPTEFRVEVPDISATPRQSDTSGAAHKSSAEAVASSLHHTSPVVEPVEVGTSGFEQLTCPSASATVDSTSNENQSFSPARTDISMAELDASATSICREIEQVLKSGPHDETQLLHWNNLLASGRQFERLGQLDLFISFVDSCRVFLHDIKRNKEQAFASMTATLESSQGRTMSVVPVNIATAETVDSMSERPYQSSDEIAVVQGESLDATIGKSPPQASLTSPAYIFEVPQPRTQTIFMPASVSDEMPDEQPDQIVTTPALLATVTVSDPQILSPGTSDISSPSVRPETVFMPVPAVTEASVNFQESKTGEATDLQTNTPPNDLQDESATSMSLHSRRNSHASQLESSSPPSQQHEEQSDNIRRPETIFMPLPVVTEAPLSSQASETVTITQQTVSDLARQETIFIPDLGNQSQQHTTPILDTELNIPLLNLRDNPATSTSSHSRRNSHASQLESSSPPSQQHEEQSDNMRRPETIFMPLPVIAEAPLSSQASETVTITQQTVSDLARPETIFIPDLGNQSQQHTTPILDTELNIPLLNLQDNPATSTSSHSRRNSHTSLLESSITCSSQHEEQSDNTRRPETIFMPEPTETATTSSIPSVSTEDAHQSDATAHASPKSGEVNTSLECDGLGTSSHIADNNPNIVQRPQTVFMPESSSKPETESESQDDTELELPADLQSGSTVDPTQEAPVLAGQQTVSRADTPSNVNSENEEDDLVIPESSHYRASRIIEPDDGKQHNTAAMASCKRKRSELTDFELFPTYLCVRMSENEKSIASFIRDYSHSQHKENHYCLIIHKSPSWEYYLFKRPDHRESFVQKLKEVQRHCCFLIPRPEEGDYKLATSRQLIAHGIINESASFIEARSGPREGQVSDYKLQIPTDRDIEPVPRWFEDCWWLETEKLATNYHQRALKKQTLLSDVHLREAVAKEADFVVNQT